VYLVMGLSVLRVFGHGIVCPSCIWSWDCLSFVYLVMGLSVLRIFAASNHVFLYL
jgi:hypothetical protein